MTRFHKSPGFSLAGTSLATRILLTLYLLSVLGALGVALLEYHERAGGFRRSAARQWVLGNEDDPEATRIMPEKSFGELVAITHEHAFSVPLVLFVLLHLVALTSLREWMKIALYVLGFGALVGTLGAPWLVRFAGPAWTALLRGGGVTLVGVMVVATVASLYELWLAAPPWRGPDLPRRPVERG